MAIGTSSDFVDRVRSAVDVVALVSETVPLKRAGRKFRGLCPFHSEKTPSFYLDDEKGLFYCFGCQTGGDLFKFVMLRENVEFLEAARILARRAGIPIPDTRGGPRRSEKEAILAAHKDAAEFFHEILKSGREGAAARRYLRARGITGETVERLQMGFAPESWDSLKGHLVRRGYTTAQLVAGGLLSRKEATGSTYDRFRGRVVFPIRNLAGETIGFGGRVIGDGEPKYLNSAESPLYNKRDHLYGLDLARGAVRDAGEAIVVEGYFDVASLVQAGVHHVVATLGTSFAEQQVALLRRFTENVVINYDPDAAGASATRRSIDLLIAQGLRVKVLRLQGGLDPDAFVREHGGDAYRDRAGAAPRYFDYLLDRAVEGRDLADHAVKSRVLRELLPVIARVPDRIERSGFVNLLAERLGIEDGLMLAEIRDSVVKEGRASVPTVRREKGARLGDAEARLLRALIDSADLRSEMLPVVRFDDVSGSMVEDVVRAMKGLVDEGGAVSYARLCEILDEPVRSVLAMLAVDQGPQVGREEAMRCLESIRIRRLKNERDQLQKEMESTSDAARLDDLMRRKFELSRQIDALA